jgi:Tfp pilus assembly protein PilF
MHQPSTKGSYCVDCHMPTTNYMAVDARRDHSMRIPRPDLSEKLGTPNACNSCHVDKSSQWATEQIDKQKGINWKAPHYGETLASARLAHPSSYNSLIELINDAQQPAIVRATAINLLVNFPARDYQANLSDKLGNADVLIRLGTLRAAETLMPEQQQILVPLLQDEQRAIRIEAARLLAGNPVVKDNSDFTRARQEYIDSQQINADRAPALTNLAGLAVKEERLADAEAHLLSALKLEPYYIPASMNLADLYRATHREKEAAEIILAALKTQPDSPDLNMAYALWLVRDKNLDGAIQYLATAAASGNSPHFSYVYALALSQQGKTSEALRELDRAAAMSVYDRNIHIARIDIARQIKRDDLAEKYLHEWRNLDPDDPAFSQTNRIN